MATDQYVSPHILFLPVDGDQPIRLAGQHGRGRFDVTTPRIHRIDLARKEGIIADPSLGKILFLQLDSGSARIRAVASFADANLPSVDAITSYAEGYIGHSLLPDDLFWTVDTTKFLVSYFRVNQPFSAAMVPKPKHRAAANEKSVAYSVDGRKVVFAYKNAPRIDIVDVEQRTSHSIIGTVPHSTLMRVDSAQNLIWSRGHKFAYVAVSASRNRIYALYCGCSRSDGFAREVHVFDFQGRFIETMHTDRGVYTLGVTDDGRYLAGAAWSPREGVAIWDLYEPHVDRSGSDRLNELDIPAGDR